MKKLNALEFKPFTAARKTTKKEYNKQLQEKTYTHNKLIINKITNSYLSNRVLLLIRTNKKPQSPL